MFFPSFVGLVFAGLCTQIAGFRKTWSSDRQPDKAPGYGVEDATKNATEAADTAAWYLNHVYNRASDAAGYGTEKARCSKEAKAQWQALNFILAEDKKNGHVYLRCANGDPSQKFKVACLLEECNPGAVVSPNLPVPGQREWCFVSNSCGGWYGPCSPLPQNPECPAALIDSFAPGQQEPNGVPDVAPVACPDSCHSPSVKKGSSDNGGVPLSEDGKCLQFASKVYKHANVRYCGSTDEYRKNDDRNTFVDCTGCGAPEVAGLPVVTEVDAELEEDDASAHTNEAGPVVEEVDSGSGENTPLDVSQDASAHTVEAEDNGGTSLAPLVVEVDQDASAHTVEEDLTVNIPGANNGPTDLSVPERIVELVVAPDVVVNDVDQTDGSDQAIILEPEEPDNNSVPQENLEPEQEKTPTPPEASLRFAGVGPKKTINSGRLEIFHKGEWGTVCNNYWPDASIEVACKQLGFPGGMLAPIDEFGEGSGRIWLDEVECDPWEAALDKCKHVSWGETLSCEHSQDVALECFCPDCEKEEEDLPPAPTQPDYSHIEAHQWTDEEMQAAMTLAGLQYEAPKVLQEDVANSFQLKVLAKRHDGAPLAGAVFEAFDPDGNLIGRSDPTPATGRTTLTSVDDMTVKVTADGCNDAHESWSVQRKCTGGNRAGCEMLIVMNCNGLVNGTP